MAWCGAVEPTDERHARARGEQNLRCSVSSLRSDPQHRRDSYCKWAASGGRSSRIRTAAGPRSKTLLKYEEQGRKHCGGTARRRHNPYGKTNCPWLAIVLFERPGLGPRTAASEVREWRTAIDQL